MANDDTRQFSLESLKQRRQDGKTLTRIAAAKHAIDPGFWDSAPPPGQVA